MRIEPQDPTHARGLFDALGDPRIYEFLDEAPPASVAALQDRIVRRARGAPVDSGQTWLNWTVFDAGIIVGYTQATIDIGGTARLAYVLTPGVWGRSIAHAACCLTIAELDAHPSVTEILADTAVTNTRSKALLGRLGFDETHRVGADAYFKRTRDARSRAPSAAE